MGWDLSAILLGADGVVYWVRFVDVCGYGILGIITENHGLVDWVYLIFS